MNHHTPAASPTIAGWAGPGRAGRLVSLLERIAAEPHPVWISVMPCDRALDLLAAATARHKAGEAMPLLGVPFAVKDNIDVEGLPTTAACPDFEYMPGRSATVVQRLVDAGAIPVGKTNLDQFATGLNGTRSPYGIPACVFDPARVSGGSSSGSAVAVGAGLVPFALGTDTAGSGRVPAAFNNVVGLKPTKGLLSTTGVVPACRSLDCVSIFATTVGDAWLVAQVVSGFDAADAFSRHAPRQDATMPAPGFRFGVSGADALSACPPDALARLEQSAAGLERLGGRRVGFDYTPFREAAALLYAGPWLAERLAALGALEPSALHPAVRDVIMPAAQYSAVDAFRGQYALAGLRRRAEAEWAGMDVMLLPTAPALPCIEAMLADPVGLNASLGAYTNFVNLLDLAALAVPAGFTPDGLPFGVTLVGPAFADGRLAALGDALHRLDRTARLGASEARLSATVPLPLDAPAPEAELVSVAVVGAHMAGLPLNHLVAGRGGRLLRPDRTAAGYSLYALPGTVPPKPGLVRDGGMGGIALEVWTMPRARYGEMVAEIPAPLGIGRIELADGSTVQGFLCEGHAVADAQDITALGGWRAFLNSQRGTASEVE